MRIGVRVVLALSLVAFPPAAAQVSGIRGGRISEGTFVRLDPPDTSR
jgi:hypothetical protein